MFNTKVLIGAALIAVIFAPVFFRDRTPEEKTILSHTGNRVRFELGKDWKAKELLREGQLAFFYKENGCELAVHTRWPARAELWAIWHQVWIDSIVPRGGYHLIPLEGPALKNRNTLATEFGTRGNASQFVRTRLLLVDDSLELLVAEISCPEAGIDETQFEKDASTFWRTFRVSGPNELE